MGNLSGSLKMSLFTPEGRQVKTSDQLCLIKMSAGSDNCVYIGECVSDGDYEVTKDQHLVGFFTGCPSAFTLTRNRLPPYQPDAPGCKTSTIPCSHSVEGSCSSVRLAVSNSVLISIAATLVILVVGFILTRVLFSIYNSKDSTNTPIT